MKWLDERVETLRGLFADGFSAAVIAADMGGGLSRNAVLGKLHRLGLKHADSRAIHIKRPRVARRAPFQPKPAVVAPPLAPALPRAAEPAGAHHCDLLALTNSSCRWPVTDLPPHMFCGEPEADFPAVPYCRFHTNRAHDRGRDYGQEAA